MKPPSYMKHWGVFFLWHSVVCIFLFMVKQDVFIPVPGELSRGIEKLRLTVA
jgi:hypothetical protein